MHQLTAQHWAKFLWTVLRWCFLETSGNIILCITISSEFLEILGKSRLQWRRHNWFSRYKICPKLIMHSHSLPSNKKFVKREILKIMCHFNNQLPTMRERRTTTAYNASYRKREAILWNIFMARDIKLLLLLERW